MTTKRLMTINLAEIAVRILEAQTGFARPVPSAIDTLNKHTDLDIAERAMNAARAVVHYLEEQINETHPIEVTIDKNGVRSTTIMPKPKAEG